MKGFMHETFFGQSRKTKTSCWCLPGVLPLKGLKNRTLFHGFEGVRGRTPGRRRKLVFIFCYTLPTKGFMHETFRWQNLKQYRQVFVVPYDGWTFTPKTKIPLLISLFLWSKWLLWVDLGRTKWSRPLTKITWLIKASGSWPLSCQSNPPQSCMISIR